MRAMQGIDSRLVTPVALISQPVTGALLIFERGINHGFFAVRHLRTRPYTPRTNGKAERFIQTLLREWAYARAYRTSVRRTNALAGWLTYYNRQRPHASLDYRAPWSRLCAA